MSIFLFFVARNRNLTSKSFKTQVFRLREAYFPIGFPGHNFYSDSFLSDKCNKLYHVFSHDDVSLYFHKFF